MNRNAITLQCFDGTTISITPNTPTQGEFLLIRKGENRLTDTYIWSTTGKNAADYFAPEWAVWAMTQ